MVKEAKEKEGEYPLQVSAPVLKQSKETRHSLYMSNNHKGIID
jgi:hypothetical protein